MILTRKALSQRLARELDYRYLVYGKELFLVERCCDVIRERARSLDYLERVSLTASPDFNWSSLHDEINAQSLFSSKKIIELRLPPTGRPGTQGAEALMDCLLSQDESSIVVVIAGALETGVRRSKWFKTWGDGKNALVIDNPELNSRQFQEWIKNSLDRHQILHEPEVVDRLAYYFEGNMLAAANEIRKLMMSYDGNTLTVGEIERIVVDQARFNVYALTDACLAGNSSRAVRLLKVLRNEGTDPILILWALAREIRIVYKVAFAATNGKSTNQVYRQSGVWQARQDLITRASHRLGFNGSQKLLRWIARADRILKGRDEVSAGGSIWNEYERIVLGICSVK